MPALERIIDANFNRAREALRVMEDSARFALDDESLSGELKRIRHDLRECVEAAGFGRLDLLAARDTPGDVGTRLTVPAEGERHGLAGAVDAAGARLGEALRAIEETLKVAPSERAAGAAVPHAPAWPLIESLRYRAYEVERRLGLALRGGRAPQWRLCVLVTEALCRGPWEGVVAAAIEGGADCLQIREKNLGDRALLDRIRRVLEIRDRARSASPPSIILNDRVDVALLAGADGVHLGQSDLSAAGARRLAGARLLIGVSTEDIAQARSAARDGADYCGVGPMFATPTKEKPRLAGPEYLRQYLADEVAGRLPHLAIGGIRPDNVPALRQAGCRGIAVSSAVCGADDPAGVCRLLRASLVGPTGAREAVSQY